MAPSSPYVQPVPNATAMRPDKGQDYKGQVGGQVVAIGDARVDAVKNDPSGFGKAIYYTLLNGPSAGTQIYVGHAQPTVKPFDYPKAGQPVATLVKARTIPGSNASQDGWVEVGIANGGKPAYPSPEGGARLHALLGNAPAATPDSAAAQPPQADTTTSAVPSAALPPPNTLQPSAPPLPGAPLELPGTEQHVLAPHEVASAWGWLSEQHPSPDTQQFAYLAHLAAGG